MKIVEALEPGSFEKGQREVVVVETASVVAEDMAGRENMVDFVAVDIGWS